MLNALLQTIANLGLDASAVNAAFNQALAAIRGGDTTSLAGLGNIFTGVISAFTGASAADISAVLSTLITSVIEMLGNSTTSAFLSNITGA